jgi:hypothetical protein
MIVFTKDINANKLRMAYNNDVIRFSSNVATPAQFCDVTIGTATTVRLYPDPNGKFFINFKPYVSALINTNYFEDTLKTALSVTSTSSFVYNMTNSVFMQHNVTLTVTLADLATDVGTYTLSWLAGVQQWDNAASYTVNDLLVLSPPDKDAANSYFIKYWQGYPFDISVFTSETSLTLHNKTNLLSQQFAFTGYGDRLVFSDGRTDETLEDILPMVEGFNKLELVQSKQTYYPPVLQDSIVPWFGRDLNYVARVNDTDNDIDTTLMATPGNLLGRVRQRTIETSKFITLEKVPYHCGVYLKWFNALGGYTYWLFENTYSVDRSTRQLGELANDNANLEDSYGRTLQVGKESQDSIKIIAEMLTPQERTVVEGILDSPKIYLFTGKPFSRNSNQDWIEVTLKTTGARLKNPRQPLTTFGFDIELPVRYTQTL